MRDGIEPVEPFIPEAFHYHAASAIIENGDFDAAGRMKGAGHSAQGSLPSAPCPLPAAFCPLPY